MNTELLIARRIISKNGSNSGFSGPIILINVIGIALGIGAMLLSDSVVGGFKKDIAELVSGFDAHIRIANFDNNESYDFKPVSTNQSFVNMVSGHPDVASFQVFAQKPGIIKANDQIHGVVVKGVSKDYDWNFFSGKLLEGDVLQMNDSATSEGVLISAYIKNALNLKLGDYFPVFFIQDNQQRARKLKVTGVYETGLGDQFDELFVFADIRHIQKLNGWKADEVAGFEITLRDFNKLESFFEWLKMNIGYDLQAATIKEKNIQLFSWLNAQDINAIVVIVLMIAVACINMISALLILILERTNMIGILKSVGSSDHSIRKVFLYVAAYLIGKGLLWGNLVAILFLLLQQHFGFLKLDAETYLLSKVPVYINIVHVVALNVGTIGVCLLVLLLPTALIYRISPVKTIRFS